MSRPKAFEIRRTGAEEEVITVYLGNDPVFEWNDDANVNYPEDLTWGRVISQVFWDGVKAGQKLEAQSSDVVKPVQVFDDSCTNTGNEERGNYRPLKKD